MDNTLLAGLSPVQAQVALSLASGESLTAAAQAAGVGRTTVYGWINDERSPFSHALAEAKAEYAQTVRDRIRELAKKSLATIEAVLDDPQASPSVRLRAALAVLTRSHFPGQGWHLPENIEPRETIARHAARTLPNTSEQEIEIPAPVSRKVGRNELCPCGSGKKFKRCCLDKPLAAQSQAA